MDVIIIYNGLGNQMSQYAFYLQKKSISPSTHWISICKEHNGFELDKIFGIRPSQHTTAQKVLLFIFTVLLTTKKNILYSTARGFLSFLGCRILYENNDYMYKKELLQPTRGIRFFYGGWHSEKYILPAKEQICNAFQFNKAAISANEDNVNSILSTNSVAMHVRRGDYLSPENFALYGNVATRQYFERAIELIKDKVANPHFFIFSNDIQWVKDNLVIDNVTYVTNNSGQNSWMDMYLMSICKHIITANSSFSWWAAWLNRNPGKIVISPDKYLSTDQSTDFYPEAWIRLPGN